MLRTARSLGYLSGAVVIIAGAVLLKPYLVPIDLKYAQIRTGMTAAELRDLFRDYKSIPSVHNQFRSWTDGRKRVFVIITPDDWMVAPPPFDKDKDNFENHLAEWNKLRAKADSKIWRVRSKTLYDERTNSVLLSD
jgi:hypothetical protein